MTRLDIQNSGKASRLKAGVYAGSVSPPGVVIFVWVGLCLCARGKKQLISVR